MSLTRIGALVFSRLSGNAGVRTLLGTTPCRIYPNRLPEQTPYPAARYQVIDDIPQTTLEGYVSGLRNARVQVDAYALVYDDVQAVADAIQGVLGALTEPGVLWSVLLSRRDEEEQSTGETLHVVSMDYSLWVGDT